MPFTSNDSDFVPTCPQVTLRIQVIFCLSSLSDYRLRRDGSGVWIDRGRRATGVDCGGLTALGRRDSEGRVICRGRWVGGSGLGLRKKGSVGGWPWRCLCSSEHGKEEGSRRGTVGSGPFGVEGRWRLRTKGESGVGSRMRDRRSQGVVVPLYPVQWVTGFWRLRGLGVLIARWSGVGRGHGTGRCDRPSVREESETSAVQDRRSRDSSNPEPTRGGSWWVVVG